MAVLYIYNCFLIFLFPLQKEKNSYIIIVIFPNRNFLLKSPQESIKFFISFSYWKLLSNFHPSTSELFLNVYGLPARSLILLSWTRMCVIWNQRSIRLCLTSSNHFSALDFWQKVCLFPFWLFHLRYRLLFPPCPTLFLSHKEVDYSHPILSSVKHLIGEKLLLRSCYICNNFSMMLNSSRNLVPSDAQKYCVQANHRKPHEKETLWALFNTLCIFSIWHFASFLTNQSATSLIIPILFEKKKKKIRSK